MLIFVEHVKRRGALTLKRGNANPSEDALYHWDSNVRWPGAGGAALDSPRDQSGRTARSGKVVGIGA